MNIKLQYVLKQLAAGQVVPDYKESGNSMTPLIAHRQPVTLSPVLVDLLEKDDIVLCKVKGNFYTHKVYATKDDQVLIGNNHGHLNGWTNKTNIFGIVSAVAGIPRSSATSKIKPASTQTDDAQGEQTGTDMQARENEVEGNKQPTKQPHKQKAKKKGKTK